MSYFKINLGETKTVTFRFDKPKEVDGNYGKQYLYGVTENGVDVSWYTTPNIHQTLQVNNLQVGDVVVVSKPADKTIVLMRNGQVLMKSGTPVPEPVTYEGKTNFGTPILGGPAQPVDTQTRALEARVGRLELQVGQLLGIKEAQEATLVPVAACIDRKKVQPFISQNKTLTEGDEGYTDPDEINF